MSASRQERFRDLRNLKTPQISMENADILADYLQVAQRDEFNLAPVPSAKAAAVTLACTIGWSDPVGAT